MATVGTSLPNPEAGTIRIDSTPIYNIATEKLHWGVEGESASFWNGSYIVTRVNSAVLTFYVKTRLITILTRMYNTRSTNSKIIIDGIEYPFRAYSTEFIDKAVAFTQTLSTRYHKIQLIGGTNNIERCILDAIDIDPDGKLLTYAEYMEAANSNFYLINDNGVYKSIDKVANQLVIVDDISVLSEPYDTNPCISDISTIVPYIPQLSQSYGIIGTKDEVLSISGIKTNSELVVTGGISLLKAMNILSISITADNLPESTSISIAISEDGITWATYITDTWVPLQGCIIPDTSYSLMTTTELNNWNAAKNIIYENGMSQADLTIADFNLLQNKDAIRFAIVLYSATPSVPSVTDIAWMYDELPYLKETTTEEVTRRIVGNSLEFISHIDAINTVLHVNVVIDEAIS